MSGDPTHAAVLSRLAERGLGMDRYSDVAHELYGGAPVAAPTPVPALTAEQKAAWWRRRNQMMADDDSKRAK